MEALPQAPNLEKIRAQVKAIEKLYGARVRCEEWTWGSDNCLKIVMTWKWPKDQ